MARAWNRIIVEEDHGVSEVHDDGRIMPGLNVAMCNDDVEAIRQGIKCINCFENLDRDGAEGPCGVCTGSAWPSQCFLCGYPVATHQAEQFARVYVGYDPTLRTGADWDAEADRIDDARERRAYAARAKESGIFLGSKSIGEALKRMKGAGK